MKIKTITCHEVYNYGASLQEYALLKYLQDQGHDAETIHYKPNYLSGHFAIWNVRNDRFNKNLFLKVAYLLLKLPGRLRILKRKRSFDAFSEQYILSTNKLYKNNDELKADLPEADAYICGSDQIWNSFFQNGKDPSFYLNFAPNDKLKLSYAASFAIDSLEENIKDFVKSNVSRLDHVSVRESSGKKILHDLEIENVTQVLDPVFLIDQDEWSALSEVINEKEKYLFIYDFDSNPLIKKFGTALKKQFGWKIVSVNQNINYADSNYCLEGPKKFLSLIRNAEFVISNSFHAVAFSIIFKKKFTVFNRTDKINTRMRDMLDSIGFLNLLITNEESVDNFELEDLDYNNAEKKLLKLINISKNYLDKALEGGC